MDLGQILYSKSYDDQRRPKWKMTKMEGDQNGIRPKWNTTKIRDDQNERHQNER